MSEPRKVEPVPGVTLYCADCLDVLAALPENSVDSVVTDPPYGLGFMGQDWDHGVPGVRFWREALRVAKPGAFLLAFGGTRTHHRLACAIEDAGWEIRDCIMWCFGSGFPKSLDISKAIDKAAGERGPVIGREAVDVGMQSGHMHAGRSSRVIERDVRAPATDAARLWQGWGTALKPAWEPIIVAMKPLDGTFAGNAETWGVAGLNIDGCRIETEESTARPPSTAGSHIYAQDTYTKSMARGGGGHPLGRWPSNLVHDGSEEVVGEFPQTKSGLMKPGQRRVATLGGGGYHGNMPDEATATGTPGDSGSAARFFYCAKASRAERGEGNTHPTVKPLALMEWLCRLVSTPTGGIVLDPFMGSGTTGLSCLKTGQQFIGVEKDADSFGIACQRIADAAPLFTQKEA